jgi:gas vesicle protein
LFNSKNQKLTGEIMNTRELGKFSYFVFGLAVGALVSALLARKETRDLFREHSGKSEEHMKRTAAKLRARAEEIAKEGKEFVSRLVDAAKDDSEAERQGYEEDKRDNLGG